jgi:hypothetical protein
VLLRLGGIEEPIDVVIELRPRGIWLAPVKERRAADTARSIDLLNLERLSHAREVEGVAVLEPSHPGFAALGCDYDCAIRRIDTVEHGGFGALQDHQALDVVGIQVCRPVGEVDTAIFE